MANGKGIILAVAGLGGVALLLRAASAGTSAKSKTQQTYVDQAASAAQAKVAKATGKGSTIDKAKGYAAKGTAEAQSAIDKINSLLK